jgi:hypothetical protein
MSCHDSHMHTRALQTNSMDQVTVTEGIYFQESQYSMIGHTGQTTVRQLANLLQSAGRHPSPKGSNKAQHACERIEHLNQGDNAHVSIYPPAYGALEPIATWCQPNFCRCNEFLSQFVTLRELNLAFGILILARG